MAQTQKGFILRLPTWLLSILVVAALGGAGTAVSTLANANTDHTETLPAQHNQIVDLQNAVGQIKADVASMKADARATRDVTQDSNTKINLLLAAQIAKK